MSSIYTIRCARNDGTLACLIVIARASDAAAVGLAHGLKHVTHDRVEVWRGEECVHRATVTSSQAA